MQTYIRLDLLVEVMNKMGVEWNYDGIPKILYPPCDIGDTVYEPVKEIRQVLIHTVEEIQISSSGTFIVAAGDHDKRVRFNEENLGKTFFLTYEEAEERLVREKEE